MRNSSKATLKQSHVRGRKGFEIGNFNYPFHLDEFMFQFYFTASKNALNHEPSERWTRKKKHEVPPKASAALATTAHHSKSRQLERLGPNENLFVQMEENILTVANSILQYIILT